MFTKSPSLAVQDWPEMPRAVNEAAVLLQNQYGDKIPAKLLQSEAERIGNYSKSTIRISDYCYNLVNKATCSFRHMVLEHVGKATYKYLGPGFKYSGIVT